MIFSVDIIADSTYFYLNKSADNQLKRDTWNGQKIRHFVRPFTVCCADGFIIDIYGPYKAKDNDASVIMDVIKENDSFRNLLLPGDVSILDRGFRDYVKALESEYSINAFTPSCNFIDLIIKTRLMN